MAIYSSKTTSSSIGPSVDIYSPCVQELDEGYDINYTEAAIMAVAECEKMHNNMMKSIGINELQYFEENGQEIVYEAVDVQGIFNKIKAIFVKLIDKIKAIFHAFVAKINSLTSDNKEFVNKYRTEFMNKWNKVKNDFEFKGYVFTINENNVSNNIENIITDSDKLFTDNSVNNLFNDKYEVKSVNDLLEGKTKNDTDDIKTFKNTINNAVEYINDNNENIEETIRYLCANAIKCTSTNTSYNIPNKLDQQEYTKCLFEMYRNGEDKPDNIEKSKLSPSEILTYIYDSNKTIHAAEKVIKNITKGMTNTIKNLEKIEKELNNSLKSEKDNSAYSDFLSAVIDLHVTWTNYIKKSKEYCVQAGAAYLTALKDKRTQYKAIVAKVIAGGKKMQRESYDYSDYTNGSYLESVIIR